MNIDQYLNKGYELSPIYKTLNLDKFKKVKKVELDESDLKELFLDDFDSLQDIFYEEEKVVFIKFLSSYHITIEDVLSKIKEYIEVEYLESRDLGSIRFLFDLKYKDKYIYSPNFNNMDNKLYQDYLFDNDDHLVLASLNYLLNEVDIEDPLDDLYKLERIIKDILKNRDLEKEKREYTNETLGFILDGINILTDYKKLKTSEMSIFYKENLIKLASLNDPVALRSLGYNYYEGLNDFAQDYSKSLYYLTKYFELTEDMDVTRPIGYIYYYGRCNNGIPQKDKAFQFFVLGHLAGFFESTYKLSDCYINGYGTIKSYKTAYELVSSIYPTCLKYFLDGHHSKFGDIALRLGNFYKKGLYVSKDLEEAHKYYLMARCAIKERLKEESEYLGDRSVAGGIINSINEIKDNNERVTKYGGYLVPKIEEYYDSDKTLIKIDFIKGFIHLYITNKNNKYLLNAIPSLNFSERAEVIEYLIKIENYEVLEFVKLVNKNKIEGIKLTEHDLDVFLLEDEEPAKATITFDELINIPQTLDDLNKKYQVVSVEFYENGKLYEYLSDNENVKVNDIVKVKTRNEVKEVKVKDIKYLYEDELTLPLEKMSKIL